MKRHPSILVIGAGKWGQNHLRVFHRLGALGAVAEANAALHEAIMKKYPGIKIYRSHLDALADPGIDGAVVATPAPTHFEVSRAVLEAGKDLLVEKPMTLSVEEAAELNSLAARRSRILMVGHLLLFKPAVRKIIETIRAGLIGELYYISMRRAKLGRVRREENVLWSFAPHDIAVLLKLVDAPVKSVSAAGKAALQPQVDDDVHVHLVFENEVQAHVHLSWLWPEDERKTVIVGSQGMLTYDEHENKIWHHQKGVNQDLSIYDAGCREIPFADRDALEEEARHFLECIQGRTEPLASGRHGQEVIEVLVQADRFLAQGKKEKDYFVHESAYVDPPVQIGNGTRIWHFSHVMSGAVIGERCNIGQNVFIAKNVRIGNNVKIQNNVSVYEGVILEDDVFCGPSMVFTNVKTPRSAYPRNTAEDYIPTVVKKGASIGANATIVCGVTIGRYSLVGAGAVVTRDVPDHAVVYGNPAGIRGWACKCGNVIETEKAGALNCPACGTSLTF
ncbi:MAG: Gfo/Idh/MocA family oxidoreductase [Firmicutes bacterium]|jgi:UDP-2-acetamido-3-amino-2,3-dideoxy-glucuronate N-acetyltransferase|nr:Gfo/Idh/MocA family oxidoreductase [Bacillota bacterium]